MKLNSIWATRFEAVACLVVILALAISVFAQPTTYTSTSKGFKITSPVEFVAAPATTETADNGKSYTAQLASGTNANGVYMVMIGTYNFQLVKEDLDRGVDNIVGDPGTVLVSKDYLTVSGSPAVFIVVTKDKTRVLDLFVFRGNHLYQVMFGAEEGAKPNTAEVDAYFKSFELI